jgi:hypothetical protein
MALRPFSVGCNLLSQTWGRSLYRLSQKHPVHCGTWPCRSRTLGDRLSQRDEAQIWADNLTSWAPFLAKTVEQLKESLTLQKLCEQVSSWGTVAEVKAQLCEVTDPIEWLNELHALISPSGDIGLFERVQLVPSQKGVLKKITELSQDPGIDEELKDIAESLFGHRSPYRSFD